MKTTRLLLSGLSLVALLAAGCANPAALGGSSAQVRTSTQRLTARALPAGYYATAEGKSGQALLGTLAQIVSAHTDLGYDQARDVMFGTIDDVNNNNNVQDIYLGRMLSNVTERRSAYQNGDGMNAEHTWPQSKGAEGAAKADLHHLFPADVQTNSTRSSFPFGEVKSATWSGGGSQLGTNANGDTVFEPRAPQKGNTARAILYFYTVYGKNSNVSLENFRIEEETLKRWSKADPVDAVERERNERVFAAQGNRNPFVDHPEYVDAVGQFLPAAARARR